jgi:glycosyltransferase involved in cell wall biosynthesis
MSKSLISCIIPVFNGEQYLAEAVESVLAQSHQPIEIVVVDDGSTDGTPAVARAFGSRLTYISQPRGGPAAARNRGVEQSCAELVAFLDADDVWLPEKVSLQVRRMEENPGVDLCFCRFRNIWDPAVSQEEKRYRNHALSQAQESLSISTLLARRSTFARFGRFDEGFAQNENAIWFLRAAGQGAHTDVLKEVLVRRRIHGRNRSRDVGIDDDFFRLLREWRDLRCADQGSTKSSARREFPGVSGERKDDA